MATTLTFPPGFGLVRFDGTNWPTWSNTLSALLRMNGMRRHLTHNATANAADPAAVQLWEQQMSFILLNALPTSWQSIAGTILASSTATTPLTPQDLVQRFVNEESRI